MRILMLLDRQYPPDIRVENEAISLINNGHVVHILSYRFTSGKSYEIRKGIHIHRFRIPEQAAKKSLGLILVLPFFRIIWGFMINKLLRKYKFHAVHIHDLPLCIFTRMLKKKKLRVVADMHENYPHLVAEQPYMKRFPGKYILPEKKWFRKEKQWLSHADKVVVVAPEMKDRLIREQEIYKHIIVVPNTYNLSSFHSEQVSIPELAVRFKNEFVVSYIGGFDASRGIHLLLEASHRLKSQLSQLRLLLVGDGILMDELRELTRSLGITEMVSFEGWQPSSHVKAYIDCSSVCVIPHLRSPQTDNSSPNKLYQYMFAGKPVVTSNCKSLEKMVRETQCGLVFNDSDSSDLADKILYIYNNPELASQMGRKGNDAVVDKYNWDSTVTPLLEAYR